MLIKLKEFLRDLILYKEAIQNFQMTLVERSYSTDHNEQSLEYYEASLTIPMVLLGLDDLCRKVGDGLYGGSKYLIYMEWESYKENLTKLVQILPTDNYIVEYYKNFMGKYISRVDEEFTTQPLIFLEYSDCSNVTDFEISGRYDEKIESGLIKQSARFFNSPSERDSCQTPHLLMHNKA